MLAARFLFYLEQLYEYRLLAAWRLCQQCSIETRDSVLKEMLSGCILFESNIYWIHVVGYGWMEFRTKKFFGLMGFHLIIVESLTCAIHSILDDSLV